MPETRRKFDPEFGEGAVRTVRETGKSIAHVARVRRPSYCDKHSPVDFELLLAAGDLTTAATAA